MRKLRLGALVAGVAAAGLVPGIAIVASNASAASIPTITINAVPSSCPDLKPIQLAADHWISGHANPGDSTWFNALFIKGDIEVYRMTGTGRYLTYATGWANKNNWKLPTNAPNLDGPEASQEYTDLYEIDPKHPASDIADSIAYLKKETARVAAGHVSDMSYVDAVRLGALSEFFRLGVPMKQPTWVTAGATMFRYPESHIYDTNTSLWWRDSRWVNTTQHWSRGNGWIVVALTDSIAALPAGDTTRAQYITLLNHMFAELKATQVHVQGTNGGYWTADVDHPAAFPAPESSGTSFFTYGLAKGILGGYVDATRYKPVLAAAWNWLKNTALRPNGVVGYVQGPSSHPSQHQPISPTATSNYGVGAFLMAGVEASKFTPGCS